MVYAITIIGYALLAFAFTKILRIEKDIQFLIAENDRLRKRLSTSFPDSLPPAKVLNEDANSMTQRQSATFDAM